jgi:hypothetical protein
MKKRGRKQGSGSFIQVSLEELNKVLKPNARVIIWNRYAQILGLTGKKIEANYENLIAASSGGTSETLITNFCEDNDSLKQEHKTPKNEELIQKPEVTLDIF